MPRRAIIPSCLLCSQHATLVLDHGLHVTFIASSLQIVSQSHAFSSNQRLYFHSDVGLLFVMSPVHAETMEL